MTIGVAAVLTMIAIGTGAETAIEDQIRAAGMNLIVVTAGNYKMKSTEDSGGSAVEPSAALRPHDEPEVSASRRASNDGGERYSVTTLVSFLVPTLLAHPEDDPMEKHDHPTAKQRLGDSEAGLRSAGARGRHAGRAGR